MCSNVVTAELSTALVKLVAREETRLARVLSRCAQRGIQVSSEHDLERIKKGAEAFYAMLDDHDRRDDNVEDLTLDQFMIIGIVSSRVNNDDEIEAPFLWCSSQRIYVQIGILETMLIRMKAKIGDGDYEIEED